jgi:UDP-GlcNAc:undecaprenyl-phosphate/decaprenyl-phosphate GlcNAc-1-phosphate transferase
MPMIPMAVAYFGAAFALSLALTPLCRSVATRLGYTAKPKEDRWHERPTALFGGVAIVFATAILGITLPRHEVWLLLACGGAIAAFGFVDDLLSLKPSTKLIAQVLLASALLFFGYRLEWTDSLLGDTMLTLFWIVGVTNAFNLLDNMDGLCAGTAIVAGAFAIFGLAGDPAASSKVFYIAALLGATCGFLVYNFHPASIFMGDTGSLFLGLNLATITLMSGAHGGARSGALSATMVPVLLLLVPILDTTLVTFVRVLSGRHPSQGGRDHTSHRLVALGLSQRTAVAILWLLAAAGGGLAIAFQRFDASWVAIATTSLLLSSIIFGIYLARIRVYDDADFKRLHEGNFTPLVVDFMYKRRVGEVLLDVCLSVLAFYTAYRLRFEGPALAENYQYFLQALPVVVACQLMALFIVGGYRGMWHYFGMMDAVQFAKAVVLGMLMTQAALLYLYRFENQSRSVFVIYAVLMLGALCASRASFRLLSEFAQRRRVGGARCIVYGVGGASLATIREAFGEFPLRIVGFIEDDPMQRRLRVAGYSVLGGFEKLIRMVENYEVDSVVLNTRMIDVERLKALEVACQQHDIDLLRLTVNVKPFVAAG